MTWRDLHIKKSSSKQDSTLGLQVGEVFFITGDFGALESHETSGLIFQKSQCSWQTAILLAFGRVWKDICKNRRLQNSGILRDLVHKRSEDSRPNPGSPEIEASKKMPSPHKKKRVSNRYTVLWAMNGYDGLCMFFFWGNRFSQENLNGLAGKTSISFIQNWHQTSTCPVVSFAWCESYPDRWNISLTRSWRNGPRSDFIRLFCFVVDRVI